MCRELAASKPLYQPMTTAYALGFDVHLFQRILHEDPNASDPQVLPNRPRGNQNSNAAPPKARPPKTKQRWREQGVDECLQLKMFQSVVREGPPGTIVLATGDAAPSEFNAAGFPGNVEYALNRGWHVELYAWESCLSSGWKRKFGTHKRFSVRTLEMFAESLVALDVPA